MFLSTWRDLAVAGSCYENMPTAKPFLYLLVYILPHFRGRFQTHHSHPRGAKRLSGKDNLSVCLSACFFSLISVRGWYTFCRAMEENICVIFHFIDAKKTDDETL